MTQEIDKLIYNLEAEIPQIDQERKSQLDSLTEAIALSLKEYSFAKLVFVCTHNSRRSQLGQVWLRTAAEHSGFNQIYTYSGGTEGTAFNNRMVASLERNGFIIEKLDEWENPKYLVHLSGDDSNMDIHFSKKFSDSYNPTQDFIAVMVCSEADEACPYVPGAFKRISLPYLDPKEFDDTDQEEKAYDDKVKEIGRDMIYVAKEVGRRAKD